MKEAKKTVAAKAEEVKAVEKAVEKKTAETAAEVKKAVEKEVKPAEKKTADTPAKTTKKVADTAAKTTKKAADTAAKTTKKAADTAAKTAKKAADTAAKTAKKAADSAAKTVRKAAAKKTAVKQTISLQYLGKDIKTEDLMEAVRNIWTGELGKDAADLKTINLYLKPEDNAAYYVINESFTGRIDF